MLWRSTIVLLALVSCAAPAENALAASGRQPAPSGALALDAPFQYTRFTPRELTRGFLALAFGSDFRLGSKLNRVHRFDGPVRIHIVNNGSTDRAAAYNRIVDEFARELPQLQISRIDDAYSADLVVRLIDEKDFATAVRAAFGVETARAFITKTNAQCMTSVKSASEGSIMRADSFIIVDQGDDVFFNCAYHEMLHALGLPNHDPSNPWTTLNQERMIGYLTVYDRALLRILYSAGIRSGMSKAEATRVAPGISRDVAAKL